MLFFPLIVSVLFTIMLSAYAILPNETKPVVKKVPERIIALVFAAIGLLSIFVVILRF